MKTVVNFSVKATFVTEDAKQAKAAIKGLKDELAQIPGSSVPCDLKLVVKQIKD